MRMSARNQLKGKVININEGGVNAIVTLDIGGGNVMTSTLPMSAVRELGLEAGMEAYAVIISTSVMLGVDDQPPNGLC